MNAIFIGVRMQGKSTCAMGVALAKSNTVVIIDPNNHFRDFPRIWNLEAWMEEAASAQGEAEARGELLPVMVGRVVIDSRADAESQLEEAIDVLQEYEEYSVIIDEASKFQSPHRITAGLEHLIRTAPLSVHVFQTTHRLSDMHRLNQSLNTDLFFFATQQRKDLKQIGEDIDDRLPFIIARLDVYQVAHFWRAPGGVRKISVWADGSIWFTQIGRGEKLGDPQRQAATHPATIAIPDDAGDDELRKRLEVQNAG